MKALVGVFVSAGRNVVFGLGAIGGVVGTVAGYYHGVATGAIVGAIIGILLNGLIARYMTQWDYCELGFAGIGGCLGGLLGSALAGVLQQFIAVAVNLAVTVLTYAPLQATLVMAGIVCLGGGVSGLVFYWFLRFYHETILPKEPLKKQP